MRFCRGVVRLVLYRVFHFAHQEDIADVGPERNLSEAR